MHDETPGNLVLIALIALILSVSYALVAKGANEQVGSSFDQGWAQQALTVEKKLSSKPQVEVARFVTRQTTACAAQKKTTLAGRRWQIAWDETIGVEQGRVSYRACFGNYLSSMQVLANPKDRRALLAAVN